jgi:hypothetical protein
MELDIMKSAGSMFIRRTLAITSSFLATLAVFTYFELTIGCAKAQENKTEAKAESKMETKAPEKMWEDFDANNFDHRSAIIDNVWFPLKPGTRLTWEGTTIDDEGKPIPHRVMFIVTDLTKVIAGVRTVVCWDQDYADDELVETELVFFAQDKGGTVWHLGQYPEEYEDGKFIAAPCWLHGFEEAKAGIMMKANPQLGTPSYSQGLAPSVDWTDRGQTYQMGLKVSVPAGSYEDVLVIDETAQSEPGAHQLKYYARGVGNIKVGWMGEGEKTKETLDLVKIEQLDAKALAEARATAMKLEKNAYKNSKNVYAHTPPAEQTAGSNGSK